MKNKKWLIFLVAFLLVGVAVSLDGSGTRNQVLGDGDSKKSGFITSLVRIFTWKKYTNKEYGYSIRYPRKWLLEERNTDSSRSFKISQFEGDAYLVMTAYKDEALTEEGGLEKAVALKQTELNNNPEYRVDNYVPVIEETRSGYTAFGRTNMNGKIMVFFEKGLFGIYGKTLLMHGAVVPEKLDEYEDTLIGITDSFKLL